MTRRVMPVCLASTLTAAVAAGQEGDEDGEERGDAVDDGGQDSSNAVDNGHQAVADGAEEVLNL